MSVKQVAKSKSIIAAIAALISVLYTAETAWADYHLTPCDSAQPGGSATADGGQIICIDGGAWITSGDRKEQVIINWDKNHCYVRTVAPPFFPLFRDLRERRETERRPDI